MTICYSAKSNGFYDPALKDGYESSLTGWPSDAIPISDDYYRMLFDGQAAGKIIIANDNGEPVLSDPPVPSHEQQVEAEERKLRVLVEEATAHINPLQDAVDLDVATEDEVTALSVWKKYRVLLNRVDVQATPNIDWPVMP